MNVAPSIRRGLPVARISLICIRTASTAAQKGPPGAERPDHGEKIWVFSHMLSNQIIYSLKPVLDFNKAMRQLPFNGKKTRPVKLRKDYWHPMAVICFRKNFDRGVIGRSVFQKLREYRRLHELSWGDELLQCTKQERGFKINDQRANSIADMAAVLAGRGLGNLVAEAKARPAIPWHASKKEEKERTESKRLYKATIFWADREDRRYAREWTGNVSHETMKVVLGTQYWFDPEPDRPGLVVVQPEPEPVAEGEEGVEGAEGEVKEGSVEGEVAEEGVEGETRTEVKPRRPRREATPVESEAKSIDSEAEAKPVADAEKEATETTESESTEVTTDPEAAVDLEEEDPEADLWSPEDGVSEAVDKAYEQKELLLLEERKKAQEPETPAEGEAVEGQAAEGQTAEGQTTEGQPAEGQAAEPKASTNADADVDAKEEQKKKDQGSL